MQPGPRPPSGPRNLTPCQESEGREATGSPLLGINVHCPRAAIMPEYGQRPESVGFASAVDESGKPVHGFLVTKFVYLFIYLCIYVFIHSFIFIYLFIY